MSGVKRSSRIDRPPSITYRRNRVWGASFDLADFVHDGHSRSKAENNRGSGIRARPASPEVLSTTELVSAVGQIWNLVTSHVVSETKDRKNVMFSNLGGIGVGKEAILDDDTKCFCVDMRPGCNVTQIVQSKFEFLKITQRMPAVEQCGQSYRCLLSRRILKTATNSWNESWEGEGLETVVDKTYEWMKLVIPAGSNDPVNIREIGDKKTSKSSISENTTSSLEGFISRDSTNPANNLASGTADFFSDSVKLKEATLCRNSAVATFRKASSLSSDYFLGVPQDINVDSGAARTPNSILCADYHINHSTPYKGTHENFQNDTSDHDMPENARKLPPNLVHEDTNGLQIQSSACENPHHVFAKQEHAVAGAFAGIFVSLCLHPVDTVKTVIQSCHAEQKSVSYIGRSIVSERGVTGLYRGIGSKIASSAPISAIYTCTYESVKGSLLPLFPKEYHSFAHCIAGGSASIATSFIFTPSEHIKQQMQIGSNYTNCWSALVGIVGKGGLHSLYAGWGAVLCRNIPHSVIKFYTYESLKQLMLLSKKSIDQPSTIQMPVCGGLAASTAALFTTPFDVVKTRLQMQVPGSTSPYGSVFQALKEIGQNEGLKGLYRGLAPRLVMYMSQGALFFTSYELFTKTIFFGSATT